MDGAHAMQTEAGARRVARLIERIVAKPRSRTELISMLRSGLSSIERRSPEVRFDAVRSSICNALDAYCDSGPFERLNCSEF
jgi:hypothetical protein